MNSLAKWLAEGDGPVLVTGPRGCRLALALLGAHAAGRPFVPLDSGWPVGRLEAMLNRTAPTVALVTDLVATPPEVIAALVSRGIAVTDLAVNEDAGVTSLAITAAGPRDAAYVLFTSGSTGTPKGATIARNGFINHLLTKVELLDLGADDVVLQTAPLSFDIFIWQVLAVLLAGGRTHVVTADAARDPDALLTIAERESATVVELVPSVLSLVLDAVERNPGALRCLRWMLSTGEELSVGLAQAWLRSSVSAPLVNAYGPTECSDDVTHYVVNDPPRSASRSARPCPGRNCSSCAAPATVG